MVDKRIKFLEQYESETTPVLGVEAGQQGPKGEKGDSGPKFIGAQVDPISTDGEELDMWINTLTGHVFKKTDATTWIYISDITGPQGEQGDPGFGIPSGGIEGQALVKKSNTNYDTEWATTVLADFSNVNNLTVFGDITADKVSSITDGFEITGELTLLGATDQINLDNNFIFNGNATTLSIRHDPTSTNLLTINDSGDIDVHGYLETNAIVDKNGSIGNVGQVLTSSPSGLSWEDADQVPLPLAGDISGTNQNAVVDSIYGIPGSIVQTAFTSSANKVGFYMTCSSAGGQHTFTNTITSRYEPIFAMQDWCFAAIYGTPNTNAPGTLPQKFISIDGSGNPVQNLKAYSDRTMDCSILAIKNDTAYSGKGTIGNSNFEGESAIGSVNISIPVSASLFNPTANNIDDFREYEPLNGLLLTYRGNTPGTYGLTYRTVTKTSTSYVVEVIGDKGRNFDWILI